MHLFITVEEVCRVRTYFIFAIQRWGSRELTEFMLEKKRSAQHCHYGAISQRWLLSLTSRFFPLKLHSSLFPAGVPHISWRGNRKNIVKFSQVQGASQLLGQKHDSWSVVKKYTKTHKKKGKKVIDCTFHKVADVRSSAVWSCWCPTGWGRTAPPERPRTTCRPPGWAATKCNWRRRPRRTAWPTSPLHLEAGKRTRDYHRTAGYQQNGQSGAELSDTDWTGTSYDNKERKTFHFLNP